MSGARSAFGLSANAEDAASRRYGGHLVNLVRSSGLLAADVGLVAVVVCYEGDSIACLERLAPSLLEILVLVFTSVAVSNVKAIDHHLLLDTVLISIFGRRRK